jgi:hypothetical protein
MSAARTDSHSYGVLKRYNGCKVRVSLYCFGGLKNTTGWCTERCRANTSPCMLLQFPMRLNLEPYTLEGIAKAESGDAATASQACFCFRIMYHQRCRDSSGVCPFQRFLPVSWPCVDEQ